MGEVSIIVSKANMPAEVDFRAGLLLLIDKPKDWTSFDVVNKIRHKVKHKLGVKKIKVGHAGTLDPMATGLLLVCVGKYTKLIDSLQGMDKSYDGTAKLGATTPSYDAETKEDGHYPTEHIDLQLLAAAAAQFVGDIEQVPPMFSALKVDGVRLYKKARKGQTVEIKPRPVTIHQFDVTSYEEPYAAFTSAVSKGTYIRSLAYDLGQAVQSGGYLTALRRTEVGPYSAKAALSVEEAVEFIENCTLSPSES